MVRARSSMELALLDEANTRVLAGVGAADATDVEVALDERVVALDDTRSTLTRLAQGDGATAREADAILDVLDEFPIAEAEPVDIEMLYDAASFSRYAERPNGVRPRTDGLTELSIVGVLPRLILGEAIAGDVLVTGRDVDDDLIELVDEGGDAVREDGGWLGPEPSAPLDDLELFDLDPARSEFPAEFDRAATVIADSGMVAIDEWVVGLGESDSADPLFPLVEVAALSSSTSEALDDVVEDATQREMSEIVTARSDSEQQSRVLTIIAGVSALLAVACLAVVGFVVSRMARRSHQRAKLATLDRLTGIGNRHPLEERTALLVGDERFSEHLVAIIDLDRFKMVNDVFGHAAGDAILGELAARLDGCATDARAHHRGAVTSTVRLGGDEFLFSLHAPTSIDPSGVRRRLETMRTTPLVLDDGTELAIDFSVGIGHVRGPADLGKLMRSADLALYRDKSRRAAARSVDIEDGAAPPPVISTIRS